MASLKHMAKRTVYRLMRPALADVSARLDSIEARLGSPGADRAKIEGEVGFWREMALQGGAERTFGEPFHRVYHRWQRERLEELGRALGLIAPGALDEWCTRQSAVEIGAGPHPALCAAGSGWRRGVAVDPLAKSYVEEGMLPASADWLVYLEAPGENIPLPGGFADLVIIENALDHVADPGAVVTEIRRLLRPGGLLWLLVDLSNYSDAMHPHPMTEARIRSLLAGFETLSDRVSDHKSHPEAYGEYRALCRKPKSGAPKPQTVVTARGSAARA